MEARTVSGLPTAAPHHDVIHCLLAIELSRASWVVAVHTPLSDKISRYTLEGCDWKGLLELIERIRKRVARELGPPVEIISCYEAGYDGFWLRCDFEAYRATLHGLPRRPQRQPSGTLEAIAGGAEGLALAAKLANSIEHSNALYQTRMKLCYSGAASSARSIQRRQRPHLHHRPPIRLAGMRLPARNPPAPVIDEPGNI